jgi:cold shock CspA family protein
MEQQGRLTKWNDARGFGFITPLSKGPSVFVHISQFQQQLLRPCLNDLLAYVIGYDEHGRQQAKNVRYLNRAQPRTTNQRRLPAAFPLLAAVLILAGLSFVYSQFNGFSPSQPRTSTSSAPEDELAKAFQAQQSGVQVDGEGVVDRVLADDNDGSRHQRFILRLASGQTLLIAHNIDIAPRIEALASGDRVAFFGQYEWNAEGGVIHWTHHDPEGQHVSGWLKSNGRTYQ